MASNTYTANGSDCSLITCEDTASTNNVDFDYSTDSTGYSNWTTTTGTDTNIVVGTAAYEGHAPITWRNIQPRVGLPEEVLRPVELPPQMEIPAQLVIPPEQLEEMRRLEAQRQEVATQVMADREVAMKRLQEAKTRGDDLLRQVIGDVLFKHYKEEGFVDIPSLIKPNLIYRVRPHRSIGLRKDNEEKQSICIHPSGGYVSGDVAAVHALLCMHDEKRLWEKGVLHQMAA